MKKYNRTLLSRIWFYFLPSSKRRIAYFKKHDVFALFGEHCFWQDRNIPVEPNLIKIHDNVVVASGARIVPHDIIHMVLNNSVGGGYKIHLGCVEILDNVFLGTGCVILPNVKIGPNAIVAAGAIVTKDVPEGVVVGGNPAKIIGKFEDLAKKREHERFVPAEKLDREIELWQEFYDNRKN